MTVHIIHCLSDLETRKNIISGRQKIKVIIAGFNANKAPAVTPVKIEKITFENFVLVSKTTIKIFINVNDKDSVKMTR